MSKAGVKRGAPKGLLTIRLVFDPRNRVDKDLWDRLNEYANENGLEVTQYVRTLLAKQLKR
jgi:ParB family chromosome partitioning protein